MKTVFTIKTGVRSAGWAGVARWSGFLWLIVVVTWWIAGFLEPVGDVDPGGSAVVYGIGYFSLIAAEILMVCLSCGPWSSAMATSGLEGSWLPSWPVWPLARRGLAKTDEGASFTSSTPGLSTVASRLLRGHLTEVLAGKPPEMSADTPDGSTRLYPEMVRFLASGFRAAAAAAADHLSRPRLRVLDLGAGAAPWSVALAERDDTTRVTAVDLPEVVPVTKSAVEEAGCSDRFDYLAGDLFVIDFGEERYDLVIAGGVCHLFDEEANWRLLEKAGRALAPGGTLAIMEPLPNERFDGPRSVLLYALNLTTRTTGGAVYPFSTYVTWLQAAGLVRLGRDDLTASPPISLITAHKPSSGGTTWPPSL